MSYDCVIATRNRINAMKMSIPLILNQDVSPERLIVIDASDDHDTVRTEVHEISQRLGFKNTVVVKSDAANLARQRNIGLKLVQAPVVMFPDDDAMWHPSFASNVLTIYKADVRDQVGGVSGVGVPTPPPELEQPTYKKNWYASAKETLQPYRNYIEQRSFPKPFDVIGTATWTDQIDVVDDITSRRLPHITGFRMSFRTSAVRQVGFDETLGYGAGYAYHEDLDVSLRLERAGYALVSAEAAKVCHFTFPGKRSGGYTYGFCAIANCAYVCKKTMNNDANIFSIMERYLKYKLSLYASQFYSGHGRETFRGAFDAWRNRFRLLDADEVGLSDAYKTLCDQYIKKSPQTP
jgi:glycosyltransferase involved in cell wall biosynthesis